MTQHQNIRFEDKDRRDAHKWRARTEEPTAPNLMRLTRTRHNTWAEQESYHLFHIAHIPSEMRNWTPSKQQID